MIGAVETFLGNIDATKWYDAHGRVLARMTEHRALIEAFETYQSPKLPTDLDGYLRSLGSVIGYGTADFARIYTDLIKSGVKIPQDTLEIFRIKFKPTVFEVLTRLAEKKREETKA